MKTPIPILAKNDKSEVAMKPRMFLLAMVALMMVSTYLYAGSGDLDPTFGTGGKVTTDFAGNRDEGRAMAIQPDGKIVVAGFTDTATGREFALARYNTNGSLDTSFGSGGKVTTDFGSNQAPGLAVALQSDGKIVVAGLTQTNDSNFALARYDTNGTLDTSFGSGGKVTTDFSGSEDQAFAVAIQSDGKIIAAGHSFSSSTSADFALARYNTDGALDTSFGAGGKVTTDFSGSADNAHAVAIQLDGKIVVAGRVRNQTTSDDFGLARYNTNGSLDTSFGTGGKVTTDFTGVAGPDEAQALAIQLDGKIVAVGFASAASGNFALARYNADGTLDTSFGTGGRATTDFGCDDRALGVAIQVDGKIVTAGVTCGDFALARYNTNGTLDSSFGTAGIVTTDFSGGDDGAFAVAIQPDGKIVAAGFAGIFTVEDTSGDFALARYEGPTSQDLISGLSDQVQDLVNTGALNQGQGNSLTVKLTNVLNSLSPGKTKTACNQLNSFINEVSAQVSSGVFTAAQGQALLNTAAAIKQMLGC
jgi:uncharacterized delta-60 repeat protein